MYKTIHESLKKNMAGLRKELENKNIDGKERILRKQYFVNLKKDLKLFEEAIDSVKYGLDEKEENKEKDKKEVIVTNKEEKDGEGELDFLADEEEEKVVEEEPIDLLDLDIGEAKTEKKEVKKEVQKKEEQKEEEEDPYDFLG